MLAIVLTAMLAGLPAGVGATGKEPDDLAGGLDVIVDTTQHWIGANDVLFSVFDRERVSLAVAGDPLEVTMRAPDGTSILSRPAVEQFATYGRRLYRSRVSLHALGRWTIEVRAQQHGRGVQGTSVFDVLPDEGTPALGSIVPGGATPTMRDAMSMMHAISSDPQPLTAFYTWSLDAALQQHQPTVFVMDSYAFRPNAACGGALGILHEIFIDYPGLTIIHAEPWHMAAGHDGMLTLDPPEGPPVLTDYAEAWGITEPPWVFVIDRDGRLQAKFNAIIGSDELRAAIASVTPWRPVA